MIVCPFCVCSVRLQREEKQTNTIIQLCESAQCAMNNHDYHHHDHHYHPFLPPQTQNLSNSRPPPRTDQQHPPTPGPRTQTKAGPHKPLASRPADKDTPIVISSVDPLPGTGRRAKYPPPPGGTQPRDPVQRQRHRVRVWGGRRGRATYDGVVDHEDRRGGHALHSGCGQALVARRGGRCQRSPTTARRSSWAWGGGTGQYQLAALSYTTTAC